MQTLSMVLLYLIALNAIVFICFNAQFGIGWEAMLKSPAGDRIDTIADAISSQLQSSDKKHWTAVLQNFDKLYNAQFYVFNVHGEQLAGKPLTLPKALKDKVNEFPLGLPPNMAGPHGNHMFGFRTPMVHDEHGWHPEQGFGGIPKGGQYMPPPESGGPGGPGNGFHHGSGGPGPEPGFRDGPGGPGPEPGFYHGPGGPGPGPGFHDGPGGPGPGPSFHDGPGGPGPGPGFHDGSGGPLSNVQQSGMDANFPNGSPANSDLHRFVHEFRPPPFMHAQGRFIVHTENPDTFFIGTKIMLFDTERMHPEPSYVLASTSNIWQSTLLFDFKFLLMVGGLILLLSLLFWWPFVHQIARSIGELTAVTEKIADGKFDARIVRARQDEIGRLGDAVNTMAEKLNEYVLTQKRFLADVSHELFSPLARLHMAIELLEDCKPEDSPRHFKEINEEIDEMKSLITELLAYSKAGLIQSERQLATIDLKPIFEDLVAKFNDQMEIKVELDPSSTVEGDETLLSRSFSNIIRNSIRYAGEAGPLTIQSKHDGPDLFVSFSDCGPGVPEETLKYLGQPFFRPEFSRNRNLGGFGLGLAIVKSCIEACNGSVTLSNLPAGGLNVQIRLKSVH